MGIFRLPITWLFPLEFSEEKYFSSSYWYFYAMIEFSVGCLIPKLILSFHIFTIEFHTRPDSTPMHQGPAEPVNFSLTSNFDLKYFCSLLTCKYIKYLIWKIWSISVWRQNHKAVAWLIMCVMLVQITNISYHTEGLVKTDVMSIVFYEFILAIY